MNEPELSLKQIERLIKESLPSKEKQKDMVEKIETLIDKGVAPKAALERVFGEPECGKE